MADPQTSGPRREASQAPEDDARIEHLLVTGLDHYFAGEFEEAINLWTRVLFLDRHHDRARAYIDRARSAQAERQRISEALVHQGLDAFDKGEVVRARELLSDALDQGASHDVALGVLGRIDRLEVGQRAPRVAPSRRKSAVIVAGEGEREAEQRSTLARWWVTAAAIVAVAALSFVIVTPTGVSDWFPAQATTTTAVQFAPAPAPLPVPAPTHAYLAQARAMFAGGKLRDALRALDRVPVGDTLRAEAERLRADIQRELLAVATAEAKASSTPPPPDAPRE